MASRTCLGCGLLGSRDSTGEVVEALPSYRDVPSGGSNNRPSIIPVCIMGHRNFTAEYKAARNGLYGTHGASTDTVAMLAVFAVPQDDCPDWCEYMEGLPPKERREMIDRAKSAFGF